MVVTLLLPVLVPALVSASGDEPAHAAPGKVASVRVAVTNVREGGLARLPADARDATDRKAWARRLFAQPGRAPDVVLLQEVLRSSPKMASALNTHPRARKTGARYAVAAGTRVSRGSGACDGRRRGTYTVVRTSAILVNTKTVRSVRGSGQIRTWGRWGPAARARVGKTRFGCAEHPWLRVTVVKGQQSSTALVASAHVAPGGTRRKNRAVSVIRRRLDAQHRKGSGELVVMGGDLNLTRCVQPPRSPERRGCAVRSGHRSLLASGYQDAVRVRNLGGTTGVAGVARRIDFLYAKKAAVTSSWHDRCYLAFFAMQPGCSSAKRVFATSRDFRRCQARSLKVGRSGGGCSAKQYRRYYSDHPILLATLR